MAYRTQRTGGFMQESGGDGKLYSGRSHEAPRWLKAIGSACTTTFDNISWLYTTGNWRNAEWYRGKATDLQGRAVIWIKTSWNDYWHPAESPYKITEENFLLRGYGAFMARHYRSALLTLHATLRGCLTLPAAVGSFLAVKATLGYSEDLVKLNDHYHKIYELQFELADCHKFNWIPIISQDLSPTDQGIRNRARESFVGVHTYFARHQFQMNFVPALLQRLIFVLETATGLAALVLNIGRAILSTAPALLVFQTSARLNDIANWDRKAVWETGRKTLYCFYGIFSTKAGLEGVFCPYAENTTRTFL